MAEFQRALSVSELPPGTMKTVQVNGEFVLLANVEGRYYGMGAICTHENWDLSDSPLEGTKIICGGHQAIYDLNTGEAEFEEPLAPEPLYDVMVKDDFLYVKKRDVGQPSGS